MIVKFGIQIEPQFGFDYKTVENIALAAEKMGYDSLWSSDHFFLNEEAEDRNCMDAWTLLAALASQTKKLRLGTLVTCNSYRHPPVLAKIAATVDMISRGRLFFGIGAGWKKIEYNAYGIPFPPIYERLEQLEEAIQIIKLLWTEPQVNFEGKHYTLKDALSAPKPIQKPTPPILIGGMGKEVLLKIVAKHADYCNFFLRPDLEEALEALKDHCKAINRNYDEIGKSLFAVGVGIFVTESAEELEEYITSRAKERNLSIDEIKEAYTKGAPGAWVGYPEDLLERFNYFIDLGFDYFQIMFPGYDEKIINYSERFADLVMKKLTIS